MKETTGFHFDHIFEMPVVDTFAYLSYIKVKRAKERAEMNKIRMRRKNG